MNARGKLSLVLLLFSLSATIALVVVDRTPPPPDPATLFNVVHSQLKAFRASNFPSAYSRVSTRFQQHFTLQEFVERVSGDYGRIVEAARVEFGPWYQRGRRATVQVFFIYADNSVAPCLYTLVREGEEWRIESARWVKGWANGQRMRGVQS